MVRRQQRCAIAAVYRGPQRSQMVDENASNDSAAVIHRRDIFHRIQLLFIL